MLTEQQVAIVKSTIPLLESAGSAITEHFYQRLFSHHPELKNVFNMSHQATGGQATALFNAVLAYAKNIDNLGALSPAVERIAHKHTSLNIRPEQYPVVGHHLLETLRELTGELFTAEIEDAWGAAYGALADVFIKREAELYQQNADSEGGWSGARKFVVAKKEVESELVTSLHLLPEDDEPVIDYKAGQYIGIRVKPGSHDYQQIRQYSLSQKANQSSYRISVKREVQFTPAGIVSNYLHGELQEGEKVELFAPAGDFYYVERQSPVVLISAGVGVTPMQAMLETLAEQQVSQPVWYLHACENPKQHSFKAKVESLGEQLQLSIHNWYRDHPMDEQGQDLEQETEQKTEQQPQTTRLHSGLMDLSQLESELPLTQGHFYLCGPVVFMKSVHKQLRALGVADTHIHYELFGPHQDV